MSRSAFFTVGLFILFLAPLAWSLSVSCAERPSCLAAETEVLRLSSSNNAHANKAGIGSYPSLICCSGLGSGIGSSLACDSEQTGLLVRLSDASGTNSHGEVPSGTDYSTLVCLNSTNPLKRFSCSTTPTSGGSNEDCVYALSGATNAHFASCTAATPAYATKVYCRLSDAPTMSDLDLFVVTKRQSDGKVMESFALTDTIVVDISARNNTPNPLSAGQAVSATMNLEGVEKWALNPKPALPAIGGGATESISFNVPLAGLMPGIYDLVIAVPRPAGFSSKDSKAPVVMLLAEGQAAYFASDFTVTKKITLADLTAAEVPEFVWFNVVIVMAVVLGVLWSAKKN